MPFTNITFYTSEFLLHFTLIPFHTITFYTSDIFLLLFSLIPFSTITFYTFKFLLLTSVTHLTSSVHFLSLYLQDLVSFFPFFNFHYSYLLLLRIFTSPIVSYLYLILLSCLTSYTFYCSLHLLLNLYSMYFLHILSLLHFITIPCNSYDL